MYPKRKPTRDEVRNYRQKRLKERDQRGEEREREKYQLETCGICCALMLLDLYGRTMYPTPKQKHMLYDNYGSKAFKGTTGAALADLLAKNGLRVRLLHSSPDMMDNRDGYFTPDIFEPFLQEYHQKAAECEGRVEIQTGAEINCEVLKQELHRGRKLILQCIVPGDADGIHDHTLHWVVVSGCQGDIFRVCDPEKSVRFLTGEEMEDYMNTPIGRICLVVEEGRYADAE
ncbi:MAG: hypothetical protein J6J12_09210 [Oscillospiraceae bacterium]|nr:hypothetical protein [Oscillospiraceae bacterium]